MAIISRPGSVALFLAINEPAITFAVLYGITLLWYVWKIIKAITDATSVYTFLVLFCALREIVFVLEATVEDESATMGASFAAGALYDIGIFALLYSAYNLILNRGVICGHVAKNRVTRVTSNRHLFYLILVLAVVFGVAAWVCYSGANEASGYINTACSVIEGENVLKAGSLIDKGSALREVCIVFFIIATIPLAVQAAFLLYAELVGPDHQRSEVPYAKYMPSLIAILLLIRGFYWAVAIGQRVPQTKVVLYLLGALPEWLAALSFAVSDLVPKREEVAEREKDLERA